MRVIYTVGYGGRRLREFLELLEYYNVKFVVDVRRWNRSTKVPEFSGDNLQRVLKELGITYYWAPLLGGFRKFGVDVDDQGVAKCFESEGFRAYATYITTDNHVKQLLEELIKLLFKNVAVIMCKERCPWLCHRKILSDYFISRGFKVLHVIERDNVIEHKLSKCAVIVNGELKYV